MILIAIESDAGGAKDEKQRPGHHDLAFAFAFIFSRYWLKF
jgi:hypothetical protein